MKITDQNKGWVPLEPMQPKKRRVAQWKIIVGGVLLLMALGVLQDYLKDKKQKRFNEDVQEIGQGMTKTMEGFSQKEWEEFQGFGNEVLAIYAKYLTPEENADFAEICRKQSEAGTTPDEYDRGKIYEKKVKSSATPSEIETINEYQRYLLKLAGYKVN